MGLTRCRVLDIETRAKPFADHDRNLIRNLIRTAMSMGIDPDQAWQLHPAFIIGLGRPSRTDAITRQAVQDLVLDFPDELNCPSKESHSHDQ